MKVPYGIITMHIEDARMRAFVEDSINGNVDIFKEARRLLSRKYMVKGFSNIQKVPQNRYKLLSKIVCEHKEYIKDEMARTLLHGWFIKNQTVVEVVNQHLIKQGYTTSIPDFHLDEIELNTLRSEDIYEENNKSYFHPGGEVIPDVDDVDVCIASALLGWVPIKVEGISETTTEPEDELKPECEDEEQNDSEYAQNDEMTDEEINPEEEKEEEIIDNSVVEKEINNNDFEIRLTRLEQDFVATSFLLTGAAADLTIGKIPEIQNIYDQIILLENRFKELKEEIKLSESLKISYSLGV